LIGLIENFYDKSQNLQFLTLSRELEPPGTLSENATYDFNFNNVEMEYESYCGICVRLRYFILISINRSYGTIRDEEEFVVFNPTTEPETNAKLRMEVGIEEWLHIEFEYQSSKYTLKDVVIGNVYFNLVRIKIKQMELAIVRKETVGSGQNSETQKETLGKYEVMDGAPVKGERIPIRYYLAGVDLTPTYTNVNKRFSTRYFLSLILIDSEDRRYFKEQEIILWRDKL
jgi:vacuolar protein sorting-associated protein 26